MSEPYEWTASRLDALTREVVERCAAEVPFYREAPAEVLDGQVSRSVKAALGGLLRLLRDEHTLRPGELTRLVELSARRAHDHLPLEAALAAYLVGAKVWWEAVAEVTAPQELAEVGTSLLNGLTAAIPGVALAHQQVQEDLRSEDGRLREELLTALLNGHPHQAPAQAAGIDVAERHTVLVLSLSARRPARLVQTALNAHVGTTVLMDHGEGIALIPGRTDTGTLIAALREALATPVLAAAATAETIADLPSAAAEAREVMQIITKLDRPAGLYRFDDVLVEYQLARPGPGQRRLAAKLDPLTGHPHLLDTLRVFVGTGYNRRQTALDLHIHRNTVDYRLHRIAILTGLDLTDPAHARTLQAALTARDLL